MTGPIWRSVLFGSLATFATYALAAIFGWVGANVPALELAAVWTSYICTWMCVEQTRWNYPVGMVTTVLWAIVFWNQGLYASAALNAYLPFALAYGWWRWGPDRKTRPVRSLLGEGKLIWVLGYIALTTFIYAVLMLLLQAIGATLPGTDAAILVGSILAQFLLDNKRIETWAVWAMVNVFAIWTYGEAGLYLAALQYVAFLINTVIGWVEWRRSMRRHSVVAAYQTGKVL
jgi:nicotinamide mononucleotide transporter